MRIKSFEEACDKRGYDPIAILPDVSKFPEEHRESILAYSKLIIIAEALNEGWKPDWNNSSEYKWYPWFYMNNPGFRFYNSLFGLTVTTSSGGSRLCFKTEKDADYAGETFIELYKVLMTI